MDPPYTPDQWPGASMGGSSPPVGEYMNGGICPIIAGEVARAAFEHGREAYGVDILRRLWELAQRDGGHLHEVYTRQPQGATHPEAKFDFVDLRNVVNRGLRHGASEKVEAWTGEGDNDLRGLPTGKQPFGAIAFDVIDPQENQGAAVLRLAPGSPGSPGSISSSASEAVVDSSSSAEISVGDAKAKSVYFLHAMAHSAPHLAVVGVYRIEYADGACEQFFSAQRPRYRVVVGGGGAASPWSECGGYADHARCLAGREPDVEECGALHDRLEQPATPTKRSRASWPRRFGRRRRGGAARGSCWRAFP